MNKSAPGVSAILLIFLILSIGVGSYFIFTNRTNIPSDLLVNKLEIKILDFCSRPNRLDQAITDAENKNQVKLADYLKQLKENIICVSSMPTETTPSAPLLNIYNEYEEVPYYSNCNTETQLCIFCWEKIRTKEKVCCKKPLTENIEGRNKCNISDVLIDPNSIIINK